VVFDLGVGCVSLDRVNALLGARLRLVPLAGGDDLAVGGLEVEPVSFVDSETSCHLDQDWVSCSHLGCHLYVILDISTPGLQVSDSAKTFRATAQLVPLRITARVAVAILRDLVAVALFQPGDFAAPHRLRARVTHPVHLNH
jgi:hypothetical protein